MKRFSHPIPPLLALLGVLLAGCVSLDPLEVYALAVFRVA